MLRTIAVLCKSVGYFFMCLGHGLFCLEAVCRYRWNLRPCVPVNPPADMTVLLERREEDGPVWLYDTKPEVPCRTGNSEREGRKWYAVRRGRKVGLFDTWEKCKSQVHGYSSSEYKSFRNINDALTYLHR